MLDNLTNIFIKWGITIILLSNSVNNLIAQPIYNFTNPKTIYNESFQNINTNIYNKNILSIINSSQPIYIKSNNISTSPKYIEKQFLKYNKEFPLTINFYVLQYIKSYTSTDKIAYAANILNYYTSVNYINENKLSNIFKFIPLICSGFNPNSYNNRGGIGFWHLNYAPAIKYGLTINEYIDERKDFKKSSLAAIKYINDLYQIYQNWELTLAAYSCGPTTINRALKRTESDTFWEIYHYLPEETRDFIPALTAMIYCYNEAGNDNYLLKQVNTNVDSITIEKKLYFDAIKHVTQIDVKQLVLLNPTINKKIFPINFIAIFPDSSKNKFMELKDSIYFYQDSILLKPSPKTPPIVIPKKGDPFVYKVKSGDVLGLIANRFNVSVTQIQNWNDLNSTRINVGQELTIYEKKNLSKTDGKIQRKPNKKTPGILSSTNKKPKINSKSNYEVYTVKSGDSLWLIARKYKGVSAQNIMDINGIDDNLKIGQVLKIRKK